MSQNGKYSSTGWVYKVSDEASLYIQADGTHSFRYASSGTAGNPITWSEALKIDNSGNIGVGETSPVSAVEITNTAPYLTLHNPTNEDADGGRESRLIARGQQSGDEETILGYLEFAHDGASDDQKGRFQVLINDGDDDTTPSIVGLEIDSSGNIKAGTATISDNSGNLTSANGVASFSGAVSSITITNGIVTSIS